MLVLDPLAGPINPAIGIEIEQAMNQGGSRLILVGGGENKFSRIASAITITGFHF